jgi:hypothetical protein
VEAQDVKAGEKMPQADGSEAVILSNIDDERPHALANR